MTKFTEGVHAAESVLSEAAGSRSRDDITVLSGSGVVKANTVLGKITASGKYKPATNTGADGAQLASAINLHEVDATSGDVDVAAVTRDAEVNANIIVYGATIDNSTKEDLAKTQLASNGIVAR